MLFRSHLLFVYAAIFVLSSYNVNTFTAFEQPKPLKSISWQNCGPASDPVQVLSDHFGPNTSGWLKNHFSIEKKFGPQRVKVPGNFTFGFTSVDTGAIPADLYISLTVEKKVAGFYIKVPCLDNWGSCNYTDICTVWKKVCPTYFEKFGFPCSCPIPAGNYSLPDTVFDFTLKPPLPISGGVRVTADVRSSEYHVGCLQLLLNFA